LDSKVLSLVDRLVVIHLCFELGVLQASQDKLIQSLLQLGIYVLHDVLAMCWRELLQKVISHTWQLWLLPFLCDGIHLCVFHRKA
jgi:hypothetical protein